MENERSLDAEGKLDIGRELEELLDGSSGRLGNEKIWSVLYTINSRRRVGAYSWPEQVEMAKALWDHQAELRPKKD